MENPSFSHQWKLVSTSANYWIIFSTPLIFSGFIIWLILIHIYPYDKKVLEEVALHITSGFCFMCLLRFIYGNEKFFLWASGMMTVLFIREIHPPFSSEGVYLGLLALFYIAYKKHHLFADYIRSKYLVTLLGVGFFTYFIAVTVDQRAWRFVPGEYIFQNKLEESLEVLGHIFTGCALLFATKKTSENS